MKISWKSVSILLAIATMFAFGSMLYNYAIPAPVQNGTQVQTLNNCALSDIRINFTTSVFLNNGTRINAYQLAGIPVNAISIRNDTLNYLNISNMTATAVDILCAKPSPENLKA